MESSRASAPAAIAFLAGSLVFALGACGGGGHGASTAAPASTAGPASTAAPVTAPPASSALPAVSTQSCLPAVAAEAARALGQPEAAITEATLIGDVVTCGYRAATTSPSGCIGATVVLDRAPSAYERFERFLVERQQTFVQSGATHVDQAAVEIAGVGLEAVWVPAEQRLVATGGDRFVSVAPDCSGRLSAEMPLAETLARAALLGAAPLPTSRTGA